jgi:RNA polymerase sigma factor (sigma-70 family)
MARMNSNHGLVASARGGDEAAARELYERHAARVRAAVALNGGSEEIDDLAQEAWMRAFRSLDQFTGRAEFGTWIYAIARNVALSSVRQNARRGTAVPLPAGVYEAARASHPDLKMDLDRALAGLAPGMRAVVRLRAEGRSHAEIGDALGISDGTSKSQLSRARTTLRRCLAG